MCPIHITSLHKEIAWSNHLEGIRKDVECTFGILKKRFMCLKQAIRLHTKNEIDNMFFACCILHNILLASPPSNENDAAEDTVDNDADTMIISHHIFAENDTIVTVGKILDNSIVYAHSTNIGTNVEVDDGFSKIRNKLIDDYSVRKNML